MLVRAAVSSDQVRWYVEGALNYWETLDSETAAAECQRRLRDLLKYLRTVDSAADVPVVITERTEVPVRLEHIVSYSKASD